MHGSAFARLVHRALPAWLRRSSIFLTALIASLLVAAGTASAYWTATGGAATAQATTATLTAPVLTAPSPSTGTVSLSWTASTGTGSTVGYYVTRTVGATTVNVCGTPAAPITALSCSNTGVANGTYSYAVTAIAGTWTAASSPVTVVVAPAAAKLAFTTNPSTTAVAGAAFAIQPVVAIQDSSGNTITSNTGAVTVSLQTPNGATVSCSPNPKAAVAGVATFTGCSIDKVGTYKLVATLGALTATTTTSVTISPAAAAQLAFTTGASDTYAGGVFYTQPVVTIQDAFGNTVTANTSSVSLAMTPTAGGAALTCTANPKAAVAGVATFAGCSINVVGTYTVTATDGALTAATDSVIITAGPTGLAWTGYSTTICTASSGSATALSYSGCVNMFLQVGKFTSKVMLVDAGGTAFVNTGADLTITLSAVSGSSNPTTLTIPHGASVSSAATVFSPGFGLFGPYTDTVTASSGALAMASTTMTI